MKESEKKEKVELELELETLINQLEEDNKKLEDKYIRLYAEFENYKKRTNDRLKESMIQSKYSTVKDLLDIVDDIKLSKDAINSGNTDEGSWIEGAILIFDKIDKYIRSIGIEEVMCESGDQFDTDKHDCITIVDMGEDKKGTIIEVVKRGYKIDDRIIKYPQVIVGK